MASGDKLIPIPNMFSKGFIADKGKNKTPDYFADDLWNIRIKNGGITVRQGYEYLNVGGTPIEIKGITSNNNRLYISSNSLLREVNYTLNPVTITNRGNLNTTNRTRFINYGKYTICLTGDDYPVVWDGTTRTQLTSSNIPAGANPSFGVRFAGFTVVNDTSKNNILYVSAPISGANQTNCYQWIGAGTEILTFDSEVLGVIGTLNFLWVFTKTSIEKMGKGNLSSTGGIASLYTEPLAKGYELMNAESITAAGDVIFFWTKNKKVGTINYKATVAEPQISIISDTDGNSIDGFMQDYVSEDQNNAYMIYDERQQLVKIHCKSNESTVNDICVIYDIQRETWLKDNNKLFNCSCLVGKEIYSGSSVSNEVYHDEYGVNDNEEGIEWYYETTDQVFGEPRQRKQFRGAAIAGQINPLCIINWKIYVDDNIVFNKDVEGSTISTISLNGIGSSAIGGDPIGGEIYNMNNDLVDFERIIDWGSLRATGKKLKMVFSGSNKGQDFILDWLSIVARVIKRANIADKM